MIHRIKSYILFIRIKRYIKARIGARGVEEFAAGYYMYIGSGKKNLMERIKRHLKMRKKKFWHIDYILTKKDVSIIDIFVSEKTESQIVNRVLNLNSVKPFDRRFGASDTVNITHLFYLKNKATINKIMKE